MENKNAPQPQSVRGNPTPLDVLFILLASVVLLLLLLWMATTLLGLPLFSDALKLLRSMVSELWTKVILGSAGAGTAILALRQYLLKTRPSLNYMIWIPATTFGLILALFVVEQIVKQGKPSELPQKTLVHVPIKFGAELPNNGRVSSDSNLPPIRLAVVSPKKESYSRVFEPAGDSEYPYHGVKKCPPCQELNSGPN